VAFDKGEQVHSIPDGIGTAMQRYLNDEIPKGYPQQQNLTEVEEAGKSEQEATTETDGGAADTATPTAETTKTSHQAVIKAGENPECPDCGRFSIVYMEGCKHCEQCGWSEC
jgi:ribonucleoside-diphosphate reductase alpha chain